MTLVETGVRVTSPIAARELDGLHSLAQTGLGSVDGRRTCEKSIGGALHINGNYHVGETRFMANEREALERLLPGLADALVEVDFDALESAASPAAALFKRHRGTNMVIPRARGGLGASGIELVRVQRALGSLAPSLSIIAAMHNFSATALVEYAMFGEDYGDALLESLSEGNSLLASGFAEGRPGARPLDMQMVAELGADEQWRINGAKRPCTSSRSMDFLTAGVTAIDREGRKRRAVALIPADAAGISREPFWRSHVLAGAESDAVHLKNVVVPFDLVIPTQRNEELDPVELKGYVWLQACLSASYLGIGSRLVQLVLAKGSRVDQVQRASLAAELDACMLAIERVAVEADNASDLEGLLADTVKVRFLVIATLERVAMRAAELLGGLSFIESSQVGYLLAATRALAFHPPNRGVGMTSLSYYLDGGRLDLA